MHVVDVVILVCWVAFWVYWLAASTGVKAGQTRWTRFAGIRVGVILVILLLLRVRLSRGMWPRTTHGGKASAWPSSCWGWRWPSGPGCTSAGTGECRCLRRPARNWSQPVHTAASVTPSTRALSLR